MDFGIQGKVAFVGASSQGLGKASALQLAREEAHVILCARNAEPLDAARLEIDNAGPGEVLALRGDLSNVADREDIIERTLERFGSVDILITNTGGPPAGQFESLEQDDWDSAYQLLLGSAVSIIRGFLPGMKEKQWGRIIAITSQAVKQPVSNLILSNSVRASLLGLTKTLASELGAHNITVNNVMPGYTTTARLTSLLEENPAMADAVKEVDPGFRTGC